MRFNLVAILFVVLFSQNAVAKECWGLTELKGQMAMGHEKYVFHLDGFSKPMVLWFNDEKTGSVSGDDTSLFRFGTSTLIGSVKNNDLELVETYQLDRANGKVLFTKSRIGTEAMIPGSLNVIGAFVGKASKLSQ